MQKIIITNEEAEKIISLYKNGMSFCTIAKDSVNLVGRKLNPMKISQYFKDNNIPIRSLSDAVSVANLTLDQNVSHLDENMIEAIDGFLLGDGNIATNSKNGRFSISSSQKEWCDYSMSFFTPYCPSTSRIARTVIDEKHPNSEWNSASLSHKDIKLSRDRWYPDGKKIVPKDVRITPLSTMLWYLGDGSLSNGQVICLATCGFSEVEIDMILIPKLYQFGIIGRRGYNNTILISTETSKFFFDFIGWKSPIACYDYKFELKEMYKYYRISEFARDQNEQWRIQYLCKSNLVNFTRLENNKFFLFTKEQKDQLIKDLSERNLHEDYNLLNKQHDSNSSPDMM